MSISKSLPTAPHRIGVVGYYSQVRAELEGYPQSLREMANLIATSAAPLTCELYMPSNISPAPYDGFLTAIHILHGGVKVRIELKDQILNIIGPPGQLALLAQNITFLVENFNESQVTRDHTHIEYYPDHYYLAPESFPLVVTGIAHAP